jgi:Ras-related protein Rab-14
LFCFFSGENVEEAFLETAKKIYQNILDGNLDLNAAESGVQPKQPLPARQNQANDQNTSDSQCKPC